MKYLLIFVPFLIIGAIVMLKRHSYSEKYLIGTWRRYNGNKLSEIFILQEDNSFVSNLFDTSGTLSGMEKGTWKVTGNQISFSFNYTIEQHNPGTYVLQNGTGMKITTFPFLLLKRDKLQIGDSDYYVLFP
jgi:hypothetical protein